MRPMTSERRRPLRPDMTAHISVERPIGMARRTRRGAWSLRNGFVIAVMLLFLALRAATSAPPIDIDPTTHVGSQTAQQNLPMTVMGVALLAALLATQPAMAFAFILCDMNGFGAFFDLDQWGIAGAFKFR